MDELRVLNHRVEARGEIGLRMRSLFRTIAKNNLMLAEVVNHLGLLDTWDPQRPLHESHYIIIRSLGCNMTLFFNYNQRFLIRQLLILSCRYSKFFLFTASSHHHRYRLIFVWHSSDSMSWHLGLRHELFHESLWTHMRSDLELNERFQQLVFKLKLIKTNARFFLGVKQHDKTASLEWIVCIQHRLAHSILVSFVCRRY